ncbi:MAG TPA: HEAT repeat domain-containing protein [Dongiaceae bacterium]|nr:HEAT repeat domain-containing protein [Dongiaceae bacterium]
MITRTRLIATLALILLGAAGAVWAQTPAESAWKVLESGMSDSNTTERAVAARVLGMIHDDPRAIEMAEKTLGDKEPEVRSAGAKALGRMGSKGSIEKLRALLNDKESSVVMAATESLKTLGDAHAYEVYYAILTGERKSGEGLLEDQMKMLHDPKKMAQFGFSQGIGYVPYAGLAVGAYKALRKDDTSPVRAVAAVALASDPDPRSGEALLKAASDKSLIVRTAALDAIAHRNDPSLISAIVPMMNDEKDVVRYTAAAAIVRLSKMAK